MWVDLSQRAAWEGAGREQGDPAPLCPPRGGDAGEILRLRDAGGWSSSLWVTLSPDTPGTSTNCSHFPMLGAACPGAAVSGWFSSCSAGFPGCWSWRNVALREQDVREPLAPAPLPGQHCRDASPGTELSPAMFPGSQSRIPHHGPLLSPRSHPSDHPLFPGNLHLFPPATSSGVQQGRELMECVSTGCRVNKLPFAILGCFSRRPFLPCTHLLIIKPSPRLWSAHFTLCPMAQGLLEHYMAPVTLFPLGMGTL